MRQQHPDRRLEVWFQDEARFGQQGTLTRVWAPRGSRPDAVKQSEYEWVYLFGAVNPQTGESSAMIAPTVNTGSMNAHLRFISEQVGPDRHVVLVLDQAGWHVAKALQVPDNITLLLLPPYAPQLNPIERVWGFLKSRCLSNRVFTDYPHLFRVIRDAWNALSTDRLASLTQINWAEHEI